MQRLLRRGHRRLQRVRGPWNGGLPPPVLSCRRRRQLLPPSPPLQLPCPPDAHQRGLPRRSPGVGGAGAPGRSRNPRRPFPPPALPFAAAVLSHSSPHRCRPSRLRFSQDGKLTVVSFGAQENKRSALFQVGLDALLSADGSPIGEGNLPHLATHRQPTWRPAWRPRTHHPSSPRTTMRPHLLSLRFTSLRSPFVPLCAALCRPEYAAARALVAPETSWALYVAGTVLVLMREKGARGGAAS